MTPQQLSPFWSQVLVGAAAFNEAFFSSNPQTRGGRWFGYYLARQLRYEVFWAHYENNVYRKIHLWADTLKQDYQLYSSTRSIYSPAYRLGEFWAEHVLAGRLDREAGDGVGCPSAIPILTSLPTARAAMLRGAIAKVWRDSNWQATKDNWTRFGAVLGDVGLMVFDDPDRQQVYLRVIHPRTIREIDRDPQGNVKGYILEERRPDPRDVDVLMYPGEVTYTEVCTREGESVRYQTYLDTEPYDWRDYPYADSPRVGPDWVERYGFVPFVFVQHRDVGLGWGWSELQPALSKLMELDDIASKINDQVRKLVDCPWLFAGCDKADVTIDYGDPTADDPDPARTRVPILYAGDPNVKATPLVAPLDIAAASAHALKILEELERDHPELQADMASASGDASGRALRVARERVEARVVARRAGYDDALVRAHQMALSIGGQKGYPGFEGFDAGSFERGELDHAIGDRPVFAVDQMDHIEEVTARANSLKLLTDAGVPLAVAMELAGYAQEVIDRLPAEPAPAPTIAPPASADGLPHDPATLDANASRDVNGPVGGSSDQSVVAA